MEGFIMNSGGLRSIVPQLIFKLGDSVILNDECEDMLGEVLDTCTDNPDHLLKLIKMDSIREVFVPMFTNVEDDLAESVYPLLIRLLALLTQPDEFMSKYDDQVPTSFLSGICGGEYENHGSSLQVAFGATDNDSTDEYDPVLSVSKLSEESKVEFMCSNALGAFFTTLSTLVDKCEGGSCTGSVVELDDTVSSGFFLLRNLIACEDTTTNKYMHHSGWDVRRSTLLAMFEQHGLSELLCKAAVSPNLPMYSHALIQVIPQLTAYMDKVVREKNIVNSESDESDKLRCHLEAFMTRFITGSGFTSLLTETWNTWLLKSYEVEDMEMNAMGDMLVEWADQYEIYCLTLLADMLEYCLENALPLDAFRDVITMDVCSMVVTVAVRSQEKLNMNESYSKTYCQTKLKLAVRALQAIFSALSYTTYMGDMNTLAQQDICYLNQIRNELALHEEVRDTFIYLLTSNPQQMGMEYMGQVVIAQHQLLSLLHDLPNYIKQLSIPDLVVGAYGALLANFQTNSPLLNEACLTILYHINNACSEEGLHMHADLVQTFIQMNAANYSMCLEHHNLMTSILTGFMKTACEHPDRLLHQLDEQNRSSMNAQCKSGKVIMSSPASIRQCVSDLQCAGKKQWLTWLQQQLLQVAFLKLGGRSVHNIKATEHVVMAQAELSKQPLPLCLLTPCQQAAMADPRFLFLVRMSGVYMPERRGGFPHFPDDCNPQHIVTLAQQLTPSQNDVMEFDMTQVEEKDTSLHEHFNNMTISSQVA